MTPGAASAGSARLGAGRERRGSSSPSNTLARVATAPFRLLVQPGAVFREQIGEPRPWWVMGIVSCVIVLATLPLIPFLGEILESVPGLAANPALLGAILWTNVGIFAPLGTLLYFLLIATLLWTFSVLAGHVLLLFRDCVILAFLAGGITQILMKLQLLIILWVRRAVSGTATMDVRFGLDLILPYFGVDSPVWDAVLARIDMFSIWLVVLLVIGLKETQQMKIRASVGTAVTTYLAVSVLQVGLQVIGAKLSGG